MGKADLIVVSNGVDTIEVTEKAYAAFYADQGFVPEGEAGDKPLTVPELRAALAESGIDFPKDARKDALLALHATIVPEGEAGDKPLGDDSTDGDQE